jgi:hypothetical protein
MKSIAVLYVCTGDYVMFWEDFFKSAEKNFAPESGKEYFVFTDSKNIYGENKFENIKRIYQPNLGWPHNTLKRYEMFLKIKEDLYKFDYCVFFNANTIINSNIKLAEFFGTKDELTACIHPGFNGKKEYEFPLERRKKSNAYLDYGKVEHYYMGAINAGKTECFISAIETMHERIKSDEEQGIIAVWHDESHWNKLLSDIGHFNVLSPAYLNPENMNIRYEKKIILLDKNKFKDVWKMRGASKPPKKALATQINNLSGEKLSKMQKYIKMKLSKIWD